MVHRGQQYKILKMILYRTYNIKKHIYPFLIDLLGYLKQKWRISFTSCLSFQTHFLNLHMLHLNKK